MSFQVGQRVQVSLSGKVVAVKENNTVCSIATADGLFDVKCSSLTLGAFRTGDLVYAVANSGVPRTFVGVLGCVIGVFVDEVRVAYGDNLLCDSLAVDHAFVLQTDASNLRLCDTLPTFSVGQLVAIDNQYLDALNRAQIPASLPRTVSGHVARVTSVDLGIVMVEFINGGVSPKHKKLRREWLRSATEAECTAQKDVERSGLQTALHAHMTALQVQMSNAVHAYAQLASGNSAPAQELLKK